MPFHVVHANWSDGRLHLWAETDVPGESAAPSANGAPAIHPSALTTAALRELLESHLKGVEATDLTLRLRLPSRGGVPAPSARLSHAAGRLEGDVSGGGNGNGPGEGAPAGARLTTFECAALCVPVSAASRVLEALDDASDSAWARGPGLEYWAAAARFVRWLMVQQRFVPTLVQDFEGSLRGLWQPWLADDVVATRLSVLLSGMPAPARAAEDGFAHQPWPILEDFLVRVLDAACRGVMSVENMVETIEGRRATPGPAGAGDPHVQWLAGLLEAADGVPAVGAQRPELLKRVRAWIGVLDTRAFDSAWRLCLRLSEPADLGDLAEFAAPGSDLHWPLTLHLQSVENPALILDARDIWILPTDGATIGGRHVDKPQEMLLAELGRSARLYKPLENALEESEPSEIPLTTPEAYTFLREVRPVLMEQGVGVQAPEWWDSPGARLGVRLRIDSPETPGGGSTGPGAAASRIGLSTLVHYTWQVTIGQTTLSLAEFERLADLRSPLVLVGGKWVEVRPEDVRAAVQFIRENPGGEMELGRALRMAYDVDLRATGVPVLGMEATGWIGNLLSDPSSSQNVPMLAAPESFVGSLRPYQLKGLSWLAFLDRFGLGPCLADDMGLGKTIQLLALLLHERATADGPEAEPVRPTLLVVPMSVVGNWLREAKRFAPSLRVHVHHGPQRLQGERLFRTACESDLVITTYALAHRDRESLEPVPWGRMALDEAQNIKNPGTKQAQAIRAIEAPRRVALTGTPIENRLSELWSIIDFLNPGLLGSVGEFRKRFAVPVERYHDRHRARQLRSMVQPFVLRRLKTDPTVIADLPEKVETKEFCYLTPEQASLYEQVVKEMLSSAEGAEGIQRRGVILAGLVKLKQICNHPRQYLKERDSVRVTSAAETGEPSGDADDATPLVTDLVQPQRSGKCARLIQMLEEVVAAGGQALVFTQFRQMGSILATMLRHELDREVLFLHGGTSAKQRDAMVAAFNRADGSSPVFILSLKAGGVGLNLTGANHVFHFDRWWNPAVESQATDRAYRIGQTRTVQVHKFVVAGTLEERIDQMIEQKTALLENVIGSGEAWLTELSLAQLRDVLTLRADAVAEEGEE
ncbi:MAG: DEAD/DEAH box helicase [Phycisphaerales bacterium]